MLFVIITILYLFLEQCQPLFIFFWYFIYEYTLYFLYKILYKDIDQAIGDSNEFIYDYNVSIHNINEYRNGNQLKKKGTRSSLFSKLCKVKVNTLQYLLQSTYFTPYVQLPIVQTLCKPYLHD